MPCGMVCDAVRTGGLRRNQSSEGENMQKTIAMFPSRFLEDNADSAFRIERGPDGLPRCLSVGRATAGDASARRGWGRW